MISELALKEFKEIWSDEVGTSISEGELIEQATALLTLFDAIYKPIEHTDNDD